MTQQKIVSFLQYQLPVLAWMIFIFTVSEIPGGKIPSFESLSDKIVHTGVYFILCWLTHVALYFQPNAKIRKYSLHIAIALTVFYGMTDEFHQYFTPGRSCDPLDLLADTFGGSLYILLYLKFKIYDTTKPTEVK